MQVKKFSIPMALLAAITIGCARDHTPKQLNDRAEQNRWMMQTHFEDHIRAGVIAQSTIYPHHFVSNGSELNALGQRDIGFLAEHFTHRSGVLNVQRSGANDALYEARVKSVVAALNDAGIGTDRVSIRDGMPGGPGLSAERVLYVLEQDTKPLQEAGQTGFKVSGESKKGSE